MHYTHRLKAERAAAQREADALRAGIARLRAYLTSSKFHEDPTVQAADVLLRLEEIGIEATEAAGSVPKET